MNKFFQYYVRPMMLVMPLSFLPIVIDSYGVGKNWILIVSAIFGLILWSIKMMVDDEKKVKLNSLWKIMGLMVVSAWLQWWFKMSTGVKMRSIVEFGGVGTMSAMWAWLFLWLQTGNDRKEQINWLTIGGIVAGLLSMVVFLYPSSKLPIVWPKDNPIINISTNWSVTGNLLGEVIMMIFLVSEWGRRLMLKLKKTDEQNGYIGVAIITAVLALVTMLDLFRLYRSGIINLDGVTSWVVAVESFKTLPVWGVGSGNFASAFWWWRPVSYNMTTFWGSGFKYSSNGILNLWTEQGLVGLGLAVMMGWVVIKESIIKMKTKSKFKSLTVLVFGLGLVFLPVNFVGLWLVVWMLSGIESNENNLKMTVAMGDKKVNIAPGIIGMVVVLTSAVSGYWAYRVIAGEYFIRQSLVAAAKNDGSNTYNFQIRAIGMNPNMAEYRKIYSQTNLSLAGVILANKNMADEDKQKASVLVQQSVREAKAAIALEDRNPGYWQNLASIYRQIVGVVDGAADWSFQAYQQAVGLEPANPMTRLDMGGLLFAAGKYDEADRVFEAVVVSKNDLANAWYNWAYTAKKLNKLPDAVSRLTQALALVPVDSGDYDKASEELVSWKKELEAANLKAKENQSENKEKAVETLETAQPLPTGSKTGVIPVPSGELNPPSMETITPTAKP